MTQFGIQFDEDFDIKVGAHTIHVKIVLPENNGLGRDAHGVWRADEYTIYLNRRDPYSMRMSTFFHELLHVFESVYEIKMTHKDLNIAGDAIAQVLLDSFVVQKPTRARKKR